jgi:hypothetical protein
MTMRKPVFLAIIMVAILVTGIVPVSHLEAGKKNPISAITPVSASKVTISSNSLVLPYQVIVTPGTSSYKQIAANCYSAIVNATVVNNSTSIQYLDFQDFRIVIVQPNQVIANNTIGSSNLPNNLINTVTLYPPMLNATRSLNPVPVIMEISFENLCLPPNTNPNNDIHLIFFDQVVFKSWLPAFGPNNTITWS